MQRSEQPTSFSCFGSLSNDLKVHVLSFAADAPLESFVNDQNSPEKTSWKAPQHSSLTHILPLVSKEFQNLADSDVLWKEAIVRQVNNDPLVWGTAVKDILSNTTKTCDGLAIGETLQIILKRGEHCRYKDIYRDILCDHVRFVGPVFCMGDSQVLPLGEPFWIHFFEPRYRLMISELLENESDEVKRGEKMVKCDALFLHASTASWPQKLLGAKIAGLMRIKRCENMADGRANVEMVPVGYVRCEETWTRPLTGGLRYAQCLKLGEKETKQMKSAVDGIRSRGSLDDSGVAGVLLACAAHSALALGVLYVFRSLYVFGISFLSEKE